MFFYEKNGNIPTLKEMQEIHQNIKMQEIDQKQLILIAKKQKIKEKMEEIKVAKQRLIEQQNKMKEEFNEKMKKIEIEKKRLDQEQNINAKKIKKLIKKEEKLKVQKEKNKKNHFQQNRN